MTDMLVALYALPDLHPWMERMREREIVIRLAMPYEKPKIAGWVREAFGEGWGAECEAAFSNRPISCFIATHRGHVRGFACYDSTCRDYFGPVGVDANSRGQGVGSALLHASLHAMASLGYAYAIVGGVADTEFYRRAVGASVIEGSSPGIYRDRLQ